MPGLWTLKVYQSAGCSSVLVCVCTFVYRCELLNDAWKYPIRARFAVCVKLRLSLMISHQLLDGLSVSHNLWPSFNMFMQIAIQMPCSHQWFYFQTPSIAIGVEHATSIVSVCEIVLLRASFLVNGGVWSVEIPAFGASQDDRRLKKRVLCKVLPLYI